MKTTKLLTMIFAYMAMLMAGCADNDPKTYAITIADDGNGTATANVKLAEEGTTITLTATPNEGYDLKGWTTESEGVTLEPNETTKTATFKMPGNDVTVKATFTEIRIEPTTYEITIAKAENGSAKADKTEAEAGETIKLTATPDEGYVFKQWLVENGEATILPNAKANPATFEMPEGDVTVKAEFAEKKTNVLTFITDPVFRSIAEYYMTNEPTWDTDGDNILSFEEAAAVKTIELSGGQYIDWRIKSLEGIEYFTGLETLSCSRNYLTNIDLSNNTKLKSLKCDYNKLTTIDLADNLELEYLECSNNPLTGLDVNNNAKLKTLICTTNSLTIINIDNNAELERLNCGDNMLEELNVSNNPKLSSIACATNLLTNLDVSGNPELKNLNCTANLLTNLDMSENAELESLYCPNNSLTSINVSKSTKLESLKCNSNLLTNIDVSKNTKLNTFRCYDNRQTNLDASNMAFLTADYYTLYCGRQTSDGTKPQTLTITLREDQKICWTEDLADLTINSNVVLGD